MTSSSTGSIQRFTYRGSRRRTPRCWEMWDFPWRTRPSPWPPSSGASESCWWTRRVFNGKDVWKNWGTMGALNTLGISEAYFFGKSHLVEGLEIWLTQLKSDLFTYPWFIKWTVIGCIAKSNRCFVQERSKDSKAYLWKRLLILHWLVVWNMFSIYWE